MITIHIGGGLNIEVLVDHQTGQVCSTRTRNWVEELEIVNYLAYSAWHNDFGDSRSAIHILVDVSQSYQHDLNAPGPSLSVVLIIKVLHLSGPISSFIITGMDGSIS